MNHVDNAGRCPKCGEANLNYGVVEPEDNMIYYPWACGSCGAIGKEWYSIEFIEHTIDEE